MQHFCYTFFTHDDNFYNFNLHEAQLLFIFYEKIMIFYQT